MARTSTRTAEIETTHKLRAWRNARGLTLETLADKIGMSHQNLGKIERGKVPLGEEHHIPLARALDIEAADLFRLPTESASEPLARVVGRVGADAEGSVIQTETQEHGDRAPIPPGGTSASVAVEVRGDSMRGYADDGSLVYFEYQQTPPNDSMIGRVVVAETEDGRVLLKRLQRGKDRGRYDLESIVGDPIQNVRLRWAASPTAIIPPEHAQKIILRRGE
jgi:transcriptional regulator with XRE-family HTH domain